MSSTLTVCFPSPHDLQEYGNAKNLISELDRKFQADLEPAWKASILVRIALQSLKRAAETGHTTGIRVTFYADPSAVSSLLCAVRTLDDKQTVGWSEFLQLKHDTPFLEGCVEVGQVLEASGYTVKSVIANPDSGDDEDSDGYFVTLCVDHAAT